ncbi:hypothetical protein WICPIJ_009930 [Wickerhamomyces pijperi]|uniref:Uncharacterized protein n=1 Tax=Wickerhamomyces pijperi TaxID=599730 RepID=A0A9P8PKG1_WICPI|nr:hypothetical protein WICPIJ_009930 [Wickerhamomyces pijperi]
MTMSVDVNSLLSNPPKFTKPPIDLDPSGGNSEIHSEVNPPTKIEIKGYEPLLLARKKHYIPQREKSGHAHDAPYKVTKKGSTQSNTTTGNSFNLLNVDKKTQGRPFNDNLNARFLFFQNTESLISNLLNLKANRADSELNSLFATPASAASVERPGSASRSGSVLFPCPPSPTSETERSLLSRRSSTSSISSLSSHSSLESLTSVSSTSSIRNNEKEPLEDRNPTLSKIVNSYSINTSFVINYDNVLSENFITSHESDSTYDDSNIARNDPSDYITQSIDFQNFNNTDPGLDITAELCNIFNCESLSFVKIIRNNKGKLIKFEIISADNQDNSGKPFDINFIKKFITYPRYKSKMKIYLIKGKFERKLWFYNDIRMLIWDMENLDMTDKKVLINNNILNN